MTFQPGQSGNPGGRKRNSFVQDALILEMKERDKLGDKAGVRKVAAKLWDQAEGGDIRSAEFIRDTVDGKPVQAVEGEMRMSADETISGLLQRIATQGGRLAAPTEETE